MTEDYFAKRIAGDPSFQLPVMERVSLVSSEVHRYHHSYEHHCVLCELFCELSATYTILVQVYLLVCLTASKASPLFLDEPNIENLIDQFWDYFFFFLMGLPLDPGTLLMFRLSVILIT